MAKAARGSKSQAIHEYLSANPASGPQQIVDGLKTKGIEVSFGLASAVKYRKPKQRAAARKSAKRTVAGDNPVSGSELIRRYIARHPAQKPKAIELGLKEAGVNVSMALIGRVKYARGTKPQKRRKARTQVVRVAARATRSGGMSLEQLLEVKRFADSVGGVDRLWLALETLEQLR